MSQRPFPFGKIFENVFSIVKEPVFWSEQVMVQHVPVQKVVQKEATSLLLQHAYLQDYVRCRSI